MDGTLINSEDIYTQVSNEVLEKFGKGPLTWDVKVKLQGRPSLESSQIFIELYQLLCTPSELASMMHELQQSKWSKCKFLPGALSLIESLSSRNIPIALGTSSTRTKMVEKTGHLHHGFRHFKHHIVTGDDPRIPPGRGKPHPDIWFACLDSLNKDRLVQGLPSIGIHECLIFEDGIPGVISGVRANAHVIWIPDAAAIQTLEGKEQEIVGDSGEILNSLEHFEFTKYGL